MILARWGAWSAPLRSLSPEGASDLARMLLDAGFATVWVPSGSDDGLPERLAHLLASDDRLGVASGILINWKHPAAELGEWAASLPQQQLQRLTIGVGVSHPEIAAIAGQRPVEQLREYLTQLRGNGWQRGAPGVVVGALGPVMSTLAAELSDGVHPYLVPVEHTASVRELIGPEAIVAPEQGVILESVPSVARAAAREHLAPYLARTNYIRNWLRLGYSQGDLADGGSDHLVDSLIAWGSAEMIAHRVAQHLDAGADHVAVQLIGARDASGRQWHEIGAALRDRIPS